MNKTIFGSNNEVSVKDLPNQSQISHEMQNLVISALMYLDLVLEKNKIPQV